MNLKRNIYKIITALMFNMALFAHSALGQSQSNSSNLEFDIKKTLPSSPEAAILGRFGDIPVGSYTGTANISVPLYAIREGDVEIPISLNYHSSGIKVNDEATWVGLGWNLEGSGAIVKIFNGKEDNGNDLSSLDPTGYTFLFGRSITGVYSKTTEIGTSSWSCIWEGGNGNPDTNMPHDSPTIFNALALGEGQPDFYQYSFPGGFSGKFYINPKTHAVVLIDKKDSLAVTGNGLEGFAIKTLQGNKYIFGVSEVAYTDAQTDYSGKTWKLSQIICKNGKVIDFTYNVGGSQGITYYETYHDDYPVQPFSVEDHGIVKRTLFPTSQLQILTQIRTDKITVNFELDDRLDIARGPQQDGNGVFYKPKLLKSISVLNRSTGSIHKKYNFKYSYFTSSSDWTNTYLQNTIPQQYTLRLKLDSLIEVPQTTAAQPISNKKYAFTYNSIPLPAKVSYAQDFWGYYNGKSNSMLTPNLNYFYYSNFDNYKNVPAATLNAFAGANRTVDTTMVQAGMLTGIKYPTGGYSTFDYQSNRFSNYNYPDINAINNAISAVTISDYNQTSDSKAATFTLATNQTVQFSNYIQGGPGPTAPGFTAMQPSTIILSKNVGGVTTIVKQWQMGAIDQQTYTDTRVVKWLNDPVSLVANTSYSISVSLPDALGAQNTAMNQANVTCMFKYLLPQSNVPVISNGGGVRVAAITNYDSNGRQLTKKSFKYVNTDGTSSGKLMANLAFLYPRKILSGITVGDPSRPSFQNNFAMQTIWFASSQSAVPFSNSAGGNPVGYSRVEEIESGSQSSANGRHVYYFYNFKDQTRVNSPNIPDLMNGLIVEEDFLKEGGDSIRKVNNFYIDQNSIAVNPLGNSFTGAKIFKNFVGSDPCYRFQVEVEGQWNYQPNIMPAKYDIEFYPINSSWNLLSKKVEKVFSADNAVTTLRGYKYNVLGQLIRDSIMTSRGVWETTVNKYPIDIPGGERTSIQKALIDSNFFDQVIEQLKLVDQKEVKRTRVSYNIQNNQLVRTKIEHSVNKAPYYDEAVFESYGPNKTLRDVSSKSPPTSYIWGYNNSYPTAEVKNASSNEIFMEGFENATGTNIVSGVSHTGGKYATSYTVNWTKPNSKSYLISYWYLSSGKWKFSGLLSYNGPSQALSGATGYDDIRIYPSDAEMTTYTYDPLVGITSSTDANNQTTSYEYDGFQRLMRILDQEGNIVKSFDYHYQGQ